MVGEEYKESTIYKLVKLLKENVLRILIVLREEEKLRWKEIQEKTDLPVATLNRSLSTLRELHFITKERDWYRLTWTGKLVLDGLFLLGLRIGEFPKKDEIEDLVAERLLARDVVLAILVILLASIKIRGKLNLKEFEEALKEEQKIIRKIISDFEVEGLLEFDGETITATEKFKEMGLTEILSL